VSDAIILTGIAGFGYHGVFESERANGQGFYVDLLLTLDLSAASRSDELSESVSYATIIEVVVEEIKGEPVNLIESLAERIALRLLKDYKKISQIEVTVHKPQAPVDAVVKDIAVRITRSR